MTDQWTRIFEASLQTLIASNDGSYSNDFTATADAIADAAVAYCSERERTTADLSRKVEKSANNIINPKTVQPISGIDVSVFQGNINWKQVVESGQQFAYIKATEGVTYTDPNLIFNLDHAVGLKVGCYHFFRPADDPAEQASWFATMAENVLIRGNLIPVVDIEETGPPGKDQWADVSPTEGQAKLEVFCDAIQRARGVRPMLYCRAEWMEANWPGYVWNGLYWLAGYPDSVPLPGVYPAMPAGWPMANCKLWQYSATGSVSGIKGAVDLDRFLGQDLREIEL